MTDMLTPSNGPTRFGGPDASESILDAPETWRRFAASERKKNPTLADEYLKLANSIELYLSIRGIR